MTVTDTYGLRARDADRDTDAHRHERRVVPAMTSGSGCPAFASVNFVTVHVDDAAQHRREVAVDHRC